VFWEQRVHSLTVEIVSREVHIRFFWFTWRQTVVTNVNEYKYGIVIEWH